MGSQQRFRPANQTFAQLVKIRGKGHEVFADDPVVLGGEGVDAGHIDVTQGEIHDVVVGLDVRGVGGGALSSWPSSSEDIDEDDLETGAIST